MQRWENSAEAKEQEVLCLIFAQQQNHPDMVLQKVRIEYKNYTLGSHTFLEKLKSFHLLFLKTTLREEDDLDNLVDEAQEVEEEERSRKESSKSNSSTYSSDSNVSISLVS